jgi:hypothetical protein
MLMYCSFGYTQSNTFSFSRKKELQNIFTKYNEADLIISDSLITALITKLITLTYEDIIENDSLLKKRLTTKGFTIDTIINSVFKSIEVKIVYNNKVVVCFKQNRDNDPYLNKKENRTNFYRQLEFKEKVLLAKDIPFSLINFFIVGCQVPVIEEKSLLIFEHEIIFSSNSFKILKRSKMFTPAGRNL